MKREIGRWNKATGIKKHTAGQDKPVELWVGDVIECRVYITDRAGCYIHVTGTVLWDIDYGMYVINGTYDSDGKQYRNTFALHKVVNENITFIKAVPRFIGHQRDAIFEIMSILKTLAEDPVAPEFGADEFGDDGLHPDTIISKTTVEIVDTIVSEIVGWGIVPKEEIMEVFNKEK